MGFDGKKTCVHQNPPFILQQLVDLKASSLRAQKIKKLLLRYSHGESFEVKTRSHSIANVQGLLCVLAFLASLTCRKSLYSARRSPGFGAAPGRSTPQKPVSCGASEPSSPAIGELEGPPGSGSTYIERRAGPNLILAIWVFAQAALNPCGICHSSPVEVLVLRATIRRHSRFQCRTGRS